MSYQWTTGSLAVWTSNMGFNGVKEINFVSSSAGYVPSEGDMWLSGTNLMVMITGSTYKVNLTKVS